MADQKYADEKFTHVVMGFDRMATYITETEFFLLKKLNLEGTFETSEGTILKGSGIASVRSKEEYWCQNPSERPEAILEEFRPIYEDDRSTLEDAYTGNEKHMASTLLGLLAFCEVKKDASLAKAFLLEKGELYRRRYPNGSLDERWVRWQQKSASCGKCAVGMINSNVCECVVKV